jgi:hypothetical protein
MYVLNVLNMRLITVLDEVLKTRDYDPNIETDLVELRKFLVSCYQRVSPILV